MKILNSLILYIKQQTQPTL